MNTLISSSWHGYSVENAEQAMIDFIRSIHPLPKVAMEFLRRNCVYKKVKVKKFLLKPGESCRSYYFICKGLVRSFIKENNKEITTWICKEGELITCISCIVRRGPSNNYIQALENCQLIEIPYETVDYLYEHFADANILGRKILERYYADSEERGMICRLPKAEQKYERFIATQLGLVNRVPNKYVASFFGITTETLSRIRNSKKFRSKINNRNS